MDRTALHVFTIDPSDAKDHDDALSIEPLPGDVWEVGIHIADVSYYVEKGSLLDLEALRRGTSVYLVDRVVPMLPHVLSSDLCSLRPECGPGGSVPLRDPGTPMAVSGRTDSSGPGFGVAIDWTMSRSRRF